MSFDPQYKMVHNLLTIRQEQSIQQILIFYLYIYMYNYNYK